MDALKIFPCGLVTHPLLFGAKHCSAVIGGFYNGITLERYLNVDLNSFVHVFEASELQRARLLDKFSHHERVRVTMGALSGSKSLEPLIFNDFSRKIDLHAGSYGYGGLKDKTEGKITSEGYAVNPINLKYFLDIQLQPFQNHIHLDIEGAEIDVLESFGEDLKKYTRQISLELEPNKESNLLSEYFRLHKATNLQFACLIINSNNKELLGFNNYAEVLSDRSIGSIHIYMLHYASLAYIKLKDPDHRYECLTFRKYNKMLKNLLKIYNSNKKQ